MYLSTCKEETMNFSDLNGIYITSLLTRITDHCRRKMGKMIRTREVTSLKKTILSRHNRVNAHRNCQ